MSHACHPREPRLEDCFQFEASGLDSEMAPKIKTTGKCSACTAASAGESSPGVPRPRFSPSRSHAFRGAESSALFSPLRTPPVFLGRAADRRCPGQRVPPRFLY